MQTPYNHHHYTTDYPQSSPSARRSLIELLQGSDSRSQVNTLNTNTARHTTIKHSRYLREKDRRSIIHRIDNGEKQAALAREFGVTRAAICHTYKNREKILARSICLDRQSPSNCVKPDSNATASLEPATQRFTIVRSAPMAMLMTTLRRKETQHRQFRATADRVFRLLLEEALASVPLRTVDVMTTHNERYRGLVVDRPTCAMVISECGYPLLEIFRTIQPDSPTGFMTNRVPEPLSGVHEKHRPVVSRLSSPSDLSWRDTFLLDAACINAEGVVAAIQSLVDLGAPESSICMVALVISTSTMDEIRRRFPMVSITTATVDTEEAEPGSHSSSIGDFMQRYFNSTIIHQDEFGCSVDL